MKFISILGSTGSIGRQAVEVVNRYPDDFKAIALACCSSVDLLVEQVQQLKPHYVCLGDEEMAEKFLELAGEKANGVKVAHSDDGLGWVASHPEVDYVLNGLVGYPGLYPSIKALAANKRLCLANKESLVMAGQLVMSHKEEYKGEIIPVDSEHSAIFQCINKVGRNASDAVRRIILTASGGPFLKRPLDTFDSITVEETLNHPTWKMGPKITVDSATMFNKGFEIIEASFLFGIPHERIDVVIHPQSIIHSMVEFEDGSVLAQLSYPAMEVPIQYALTYPNREPTRVEPLDLPGVGALDFEKPEMKRFPALALARRALDMGGTAPAALNLANDEAVRLFLDGKMSFKGITVTVEKVLDEVEVVEDYSFNDIKRLRDWVLGKVTELSS